MTSPQPPKPSYPPGTQPYDVLNGLRIGALAGALLGMVFVALLGAGGLIAVILLAMVGGTIGYAWERHHNDRRDR